MQIAPVSGGQQFSATAESINHAGAATETMVFKNNVSSEVGHPAIGDQISSIKEAISKENPAAAMSVHKRALAM
jgi:hypothetical protein